MRIDSGTRLGPYEIVSSLGAGGMGEVWRARDTRLDRSVAVKVLPFAVANDAGFRARFEREAKLISQLNHPNICTLHDVGTEGDTSYLVMELVEGESLADRLMRGALPMAEVLRYGAEIADALDRAHRAGIVHRDLKPGNVMITKSGVKLLDFGLAKIAAPSSLSSPHEQTVVQQKPLTAEGTIVGTIQYMAPEQLSGDPVDARSDLFALGAMLYEMATGNRAFAGATRTSLVAAILSSEPRPVTELQPLSPPAFEHVLEKCLAKDPERRWQSAHDIADELRWCAGQMSMAPASPASPAGRSGASLLPWFLALLALAGGAWGWMRPSRRAEGRVIKTMIGAKLDRTWRIGAVLSPDGRRVAYPEAGSLWIRNLDELAPQMVPVSADHLPVLFWSPDSKWLAFISDSKLWKIAPGSNAASLIASLPTASSRFHSGAWGGDERIVLSLFRGGLYQVSARGGSVSEFLKPDANLVDFHDLSFLPDGRTLLAVAHKLESTSSVESIVGSTRRTIAVFDQGVGGAVYADGHLLVVLSGANGGIWALPFSLRTMSTTGEKFLVAAGAGSLTASREGSIVYTASVQDQPSRLVRLDAGGKVVARIGGVIDGAEQPVVSHDEKIVALGVRRSDGGQSVDLVDLATGNRRALLESGVIDSYPLAWSHDDRRLLVQRVPPNWSDPAFGIWLLPMNGEGGLTKVVGGWFGRFSPDDREVVFLTFGLRGSSTIATIPLAGSAVTEVVKNPAMRLGVSLSPDGRFLAYSEVSTVPEVFVTRYPSGEGKWQVSRQGGTNPQWSADGKAIYFQPREEIAAATFTDVPSVTISEPKTQFPRQADIPLGELRRLGDGSWIAIERLPNEKSAVVLVQNWLSEFSSDDRH